MPKIACCIECGDTDPARFYRKSDYNHLFYSRCKSCTKLSRENYSLPDADKSGHTSENQTIQILQSVGIFATPGKVSSRLHYDIVAWGIVNIEVKLGIFSNGGPDARFRFTHRQVSHPRRDLCVLIMPRKHDKTYHVFRATHDIFYKYDGAHRPSVYYHPNPKFTRPHSLVGPKLTKDIMIAHQNYWELIEIVKQEKVALMKNVSTVEQGWMPSTIW